MEPSSDITSELESFRELWRAEVRARNPDTLGRQEPDNAPGSSTSGASRASVPLRKPPPAVKSIAPDYDEDYVRARSFDEPTAEESTSARPPTHQDDAAGKEPVSALDHYERAVEKEAQGVLGDSLRLYRKAFRMDSRVDQIYKKKHFPAPMAPKSTQADASSATAMPARHPGHDQSQPTEDLIASFSDLSIEPAAPEIEGMPQPPCPIAELPNEILIHILQDVAVLDVGDFVRLSRVCKRLAFLVAMEDRIWRRVCLGAEFGFSGMHYDWQLGVRWGSLADDAVGATLPAGRELAPTEEGESQLRRRAEEEKQVATELLLHGLYGSSWQRMFRSRPRVRFNGCYISNVNYIRAGQASANQITWNSPVHIVTYYRYLRFFRDGTAISLLTTAEPADVVHHLTRDALAQHRGGQAPHLPSAVMQYALRGRWRLASTVDNPERPLAEAEGDLVVETEGVGRYVYRLELSLRSVGRGGPRNNKLAWRGFYSYNPLTDDWGEFGLKNGRPFLFSRVKSYSAGA